MVQSKSYMITWMIASVLVAVVSCVITYYVTKTLEKNESPS